MTSRRLLVIDDDDSVREIAQLALEIVGGWHVITATSGQEGCDQAEKNLPDAVLLDVMMPDMDGPTTYTRLRNRPETAHIPIIFLTAKSQPDSSRQWPGLDLAGVIAKPFDPMTLARRVAALLNWSEA